MVCRVPCDVCLLRDAIGWSSEVFAFLHRGVEGIPSPIISPVHVSQHVFPGIDLDLSRTGHIQPIDGGTTYIISC